MKKIVTIVLIFLLLPISVLAQNASQLMSEANRLFESGEYKQAKEKFSDVYLEYGYKEANEKVDACIDCLNLLSKALSFEREGDYPSAIDSYQSVLGINSKDPNVSNYITSCKQKQYKSLIEETRQLYREGKYEDAKLKLQQYSQASGQTDENLLKSITECQLWSSEANNACASKNYLSAKTYFEKILALNPTDAKSAQGLAEVNRLNHKVNTVYVKEPTKKSLRPIKNKFDFYVYSGFSNPVAFGGGIGFNVSYFHLSIDGGGPMGQEGIKDGHLYEKDFKNCVKLNNNTYVQGNMQLAITPGINLKYFGIGVGLGTMMTKELSINEEFLSGYFLGDESDKSRFLIRPTINGFIPFDSDYTAGLMIMAGYNIVNGISGLNQFILGLGMFF